MLNARLSHICVWVHPQDQTTALTGIEGLDPTRPSVDQSKDIMKRIKLVLLCRSNERREIQGEAGRKGERDRLGRRKERKEGREHEGLRKDWEKIGERGDGKEKKRHENKY